MMGARCQCERPMVFRGQETCLKCGHTARDVDLLRPSDRRTADALLELIVQPRGGRTVRGDPE